MGMRSKCFGDCGGWGLEGHEGWLGLWGRRCFHKDDLEKASCVGEDLFNRRWRVPPATWMCVMAYEQVPQKPWQPPKKTQETVAWHAERRRKGKLTCRAVT